MKNLLIFSTLLIFISCSTSKKSNVENKVDVYNPELASAYGADDYGMKKYIMAFLKKGPNRDIPKEEAMKLQRAHLDNITRMAKNGDLVLAGPFLDDGDIRGIYIFNVDSIEKAKELTSTDPAIKAGSLVMELKEWYGSAALMGVNQVHSKLQKKNI